MKIGAVNRLKIEMLAETSINFLQRTVNVLLLIVKYSFLFILLFLLASHDNANPKLGGTSFEFYSAEFRKIMIQNEQKLPIKTTKIERQLIDQFYANRQYMPAWTTNFEVRSTFEELNVLIKNAYNYGLLPETYCFTDLKELKGKLKNQTSDNEKLVIRSELEKLATLSAIRLMSHISNGIRQQDSSLYYQSLIKDMPDYLSQLIDNNHLSEGILELQPANRQYVSLQRAAARYFIRAGADTARYSISELEQDPGLISKRLVYKGYLDNNFANDSNAIYTAIRKFQKTHYLEVTGIADKKTLLALVTSIQEDFYRIAINLDRLRKDALRNEQYILVNLPEFKLHYYDERGVCKDFNVIIGKEDTPTPLLSSNIEWIIANPYWTVPQSISRNEIIPLIKKDSLYLERNKFTVVDNYSKPVDISGIDWATVKPDDFNYWFKQDNQNSSLGAIKFLFPNEHAVYLHDTPAKKLFERRFRTFSHGCVRVQNPEELAQLIIEDYCNTSTNIDVKVIVGKKRYHEIKIEKTLPIHIRYYTCTVDNLGDIYFHPDVYSMDDAIAKELFGKSAWE
jgi:murein L,D-transpeptidase YcbB/YkuD